MHFFILSWSHRPVSQTTKVAEYVDHTIKALFPDTTTFLFNLKNNPLPLRNDRFRDHESEEYKQFMQTTRSPIQEHLKNADGLVVLSPERSWMATPAVKNFFLYCSPRELANKPALLMSVSASRGGRYPIAELRMSSYKNTQLVYIPQHVIVDHVKEVLNHTALEADEKADRYIRNRIQYSLRMLHEYMKALRQVRASGVLDLETYPNGM